MKRVKGQADLIYYNNTFYLMVVVDVPDADPIDSDGVIGVDMGIIQKNNISKANLKTGDYGHKVIIRSWTHVHPE